MKMVFLYDNGKKWHSNNVDQYTFYGENLLYKRVTKKRGVRITEDVVVALRDLVSVTVKDTYTGEINYIPLKKRQACAKLEQKRIADTRAA